MHYLVDLLEKLRLLGSIVGKYLEAACNFWYIAGPEPKLSASDIFEQRESKSKSLFANNAYSEKQKLRLAVNN